MAIRRGKRVSSDGRSHRDPKHARLYKWEMESEAYQSLGSHARALLMEFRMLYNGDNNGEIYMGLRQMMARLHVGRKAAEIARDQLIDRGFVKVMREGSFNVKIRHATEWAITNEPVGDATLPTKEYMSWKAPQFNTVSLRSTDGVPREHRGLEKEANKRLHGVPKEHRKPANQGCHGVPREHTTSLPRGTGTDG